jgi:hypothetical protein
MLGPPPGYYEPEYCTQSVVVTSEYPMILSSGSASPALLDFDYLQNFDTFLSTSTVIAVVAVHDAD